MSGVTQAQALAVLRDLVEEAGGRVDDEVRVELARWLPRLRIATAWPDAATGQRVDAAAGHMLAEVWERFDEGGYRGRIAADLHPDGYSPTFGWPLEARAWADERLRAAGWALAPEEGA